MRTTYAWIVEVYRDIKAAINRDDAWTEIYETEEEARRSAETIERVFGYLTDIYVDEVDLYSEEEEFAV